MLLIFQHLCVLYSDGSLTALALAQNRLQYILRLLLLATFQYTVSCQSPRWSSHSSPHLFLITLVKKIRILKLCYEWFSWSLLRCLKSGMSSKKVYFSKEKCETCENTLFDPIGCSLVAFSNWVELNRRLFTRETLFVATKEQIHFYLCDVLL